MKKVVYLGFLLISFTLINCKGKVDVLPCNGSNPTYTSAIKTIMDNNCASADCHSASKKQAGYDLSSYEGTKAGASNDAFLGSIENKFGYSNMPRGGSKLPDSVITSISCWVQNGTPK